MTDKAQTFSAFASAFVDCFLLFSRRLRSSAPNVVRSLVGGSTEAGGADTGSDTVLHDFVRNQITRFVDEIFQGRLQLDPPAATKPLSEVVTKLDEVDKGLATPAAVQSLTNSFCEQSYQKLRGSVSRIATPGCYESRPGPLKPNTSLISKISSSPMLAHYLKALSSH